MERKFTLYLLLNTIKIWHCVEICLLYILPPEALQ